MKFLNLILLIFNLVGCLPDVKHTPTPFITTWDTSILGESAANQIILPLDEDGFYDFVVDWGDGRKDKITSWDSPNKLHAYDAPGIYDIKMRGKFTIFRFENVGDKNKILDIKRWGNNRWASMLSAFWGCENLNVSAKDAPNFIEGINLNSMFREASSFNSSVNHWDVSSVTDMGLMFRGASSFNQDLDLWDISNVKVINQMFSGAIVFNGDITTWNISNVTNLGNTFANARDFNRDISLWNTSRVRTMNAVFRGAISFNQDISSWNTSSVVRMFDMFWGATSFNQDISIWDTSNVTEMNQMFRNATNFNQDLSRWDVRNVTSRANFADGTDPSWTNDRKPQFP